MDTPRTNAVHSAKVAIELRLGGRVIPVDHLGPGYFISYGTSDHPPAVGEMHLTIDSEERRWPVRLDHGMRADTPKTHYTIPAAAQQAA
jgi:hypothetical protein